MALSKIDVANMLTGVAPVANGGTGLTSGFVNGGGLTMANQWRLTADFNNNADPIASNWEVCDTHGYISLGSNMTESSGIFTFPATGIYYIEFHSTHVAAAIDGLMDIVINTTTDNSSYNVIARKSFGISRASDYMEASTSTMFDVTNTTNCKVSFSIASVSSDTTTRGHGGQNETFVTIIRLGDT